MNKSIKIWLVLTIIIIVPLVFIFSGYFESEEDKFVGKWSPDAGVGLMILFSNGTGTMQNDLIFTWELKNGKFVMHYETSYEKVITYINNYSFFDNNKKLVLTDSNTGISHTFIKEPSEYLHLKSGDMVDIEGEIVGVSYINTSYGSLPIISLNSSITIFREANLLDDKIYDIDGWYDSLEIYGNPEEKYNKGDNINITLHFEEFQLDNAKFLWAKELGIYLKLPSAISIALDSTSYIAGFYLKFISSDKEGNSSFEVYTTNEDQYSLNLFNVSLKKVSHDLDLQENVVFSNLLENTLNLFESEYIFISSMEGEKIDYMNSLDEGVSQNGFIEFIDKNSNGLIDDNDVFNLSFIQTDDDTELETYLLLIGVEDLGNFNNIAAGVKYLINWYDGIYEQLYEKEMMALKYVSHEENGTVIDTTLRVSKINYVTNLSTGNHQVMLHTDYCFLNEVLLEGTIIEEDNILVEFIDSNKNGLLDVDDLFLINGLENNTSVELNIIKQGDQVAYYPWIVGVGHVRGI